MTGIYVLIPLLACFIGNSDAAERPNILFIMSDDHACNAISSYGGRLAEVAPTPNIDRIAHEGMRLDKCFVTNSICTPSRAMILSGQHSHVNTVRTLRDVFPRKVDQTQRRSGIMHVRTINTVSFASLDCPFRTQRKWGQEPKTKWPGGCFAFLVPDPFSDQSRNPKFKV